MRCTIRFSPDNPDQGDGYCLWCREELRYTPGELAKLRADGLASPLVDRHNWKRDYARRHPQHWRGPGQLAGVD